MVFNIDGLTIDCENIDDLTIDSLVPYLPLHFGSNYSTTTAAAVYK